VEGRAEPWGGVWKLQGGSVLVRMDWPVLGSGQGGSNGGFGDLLASERRPLRLLNNRLPKWWKN